MLDQLVAESERGWPGFSQGKLPSPDKLDEANSLIRQACCQASMELERLGWPTLFPEFPDQNRESKDE